MIRPLLKVIRFAVTQGVTVGIMIQVDNRRGGWITCGASGDIDVFWAREIRRLWNGFPE
jgi:hypothetical protein